MDKMEQDRRVWGKSKMTLLSPIQPQYTVDNTAFKWNIYQHLVARKATGKWFYTVEEIVQTQAIM